MKKRKPNAKERALNQEWGRMLAKHSAPLERGAKAKGVRVEKVVVTVSADPLPSKGTSFQSLVGSTAPREHRVYTGTKMLGMGTMHKSNTVPVFSAEDAESIAKMRR